MKTFTFCLTLALLAAGCQSTTEIVLDERYQQIKTIVASANCVSPEGPYKTIVHSATDYTYFHQRFSYREATTNLMVIGSECFLLDSALSVIDTLTEANRFFIRSHEFHKISIAPHEYFSNLTFSEEQVFNGSMHQVYSGLDGLGHPSEVYYDEANRRIAGFSIQNPGDSSEIITTRHTSWAETDFGPMVKTLEIDQGGHSLFTFDFETIALNDQAFKRLDLR
ncbi:MAG: hypothetical protein Tsb0034_12660 [Ekhidna sp.]